MVAALPALSAMLIGGGQIVRFDRSYPIDTPANADRPFVYWLTPAVLAALAGKPVIWNAIGAATGWPHSSWHNELLREIFAASQFIGVRDVLSQDDLAKIAPEAAIEFLPDTAFSLSRLWPLEEESVVFTNWRRELGLEGRYIVVQATTEVGKYRSQIESLLKSMGDTKVVILPICWSHGDHAEKFPELKSLNGKVHLQREWLAPRLTSEIIGRAEFVFASSLHACITALSYGVPGARIPICPGRSKFDLLNAFDGIVDIGQQSAVYDLMCRGRRLEPRVIAYADRLESYWNDVADVVLHPPEAQCDLARVAMLRWLARECGAPHSLGLAQSCMVKLRAALAAMLPGKQILLGRGVSLAKRLGRYCLPARRLPVSAPLADPKPKAQPAD